MEKHYSVIIERDKEVLIVETPVLMVRGKETYLWGKASPLYDSQGTVIGAIESIRDITGRKQAEMALRNSEQRLADIINFLPDPTFVIDNEHKVIAWNRAMEEMTGVPGQEILGQGNHRHGQAIYGDKRPVMADLILAPNEKIEKSYYYAERDKGTLIMENPTPNLAGKEAFLWGKATLLYDSVGNITGAIESIRDITERKKVENELFRLKKAVEGSSNAILLTDKDGMYVNYCNEAFAALWVTRRDKSIPLAELPRSIATTWSPGIFTKP
jgi:PAS domain S-box-containing protein